MKRKQTISQPERTGLTMTIRTKYPRNRVSKPQRLQVIRDFTPDHILYDTATAVDRSELDALIVRVSKIDRRLGNDLEEAVNSITTPLIEAGFIAGWWACRNPESLIFQGAE